MIDLHSYGDLIHKYGYIALYLGGLFEGESVALIGGCTARMGSLSLPWVMLSLQLGVFTSDQICFYAGRYLGHFLLRLWPGLGKKISSFSNRISAHQTKITLTFQWIPGCSAIIPIALGMSPMPAWKYLWLDLIGSIIWALIIPLVGYAMGAAAESILGTVHDYIGLIIGLALVISFIVIKRRAFVFE